MQYRPFNYQKFCIDLVVKQKRVGLFLDMGMGKTVITLTAIEKLMFDYCFVRKVLIIAPLRPAEDVWPAEIKKWDHLSDLRISCILGCPGHRESCLNAEADIYIINREMVTWLIQRLHGQWPFDMVVIDELSSFKSSGSQRFRALRKVISKSERVVGLTGTPSANGLLGLWPQVFLLDGGETLGKTLTAYRARYFTPGRRGPSGEVWTWDLRPGAKEEIFKRLSGLCVSLKSEDFLDLPDTRYIVQPVEAPQAVKKKYETFKQSMVLSDDISAATAGVLANKLLQYASGAVYDDEGNAVEQHDLKLQKLQDLIESAGDNNVLLFYTFRHEFERLKKLFPDVVHIKEENAVERWNKGEIRLLAANPASAGHGLNLQFGGHIIIWLGLTWDLELYQQANKRLSRPGQTEKVLIYHIVMKGMIDEKIANVVLKKKSLLQSELLDFLKEELER